MKDKYRWNSAVPSIGDPDVPFIISLISGKGGVGKTILAYNLADMIARRGWKTMLIDADWFFGNLHTLTNSSIGITLADVIRNPKHTGKAKLNLNDHLDFITAPIDYVENEFCIVKFARFLKDSRRMFSSYDFIILDTPSGHLDIIALAHSVSDLGLLVLIPELLSIANSYGLYKYLIKANKINNIHIFSNRAEFGRDCEYMYQKFAVLCEKFLGRIPPNSGYLLELEEVAESVSRQKSIVETSPDSPATDQILKLCDFITEMRAQNKVSQSILKESTIKSETVLADIKE
jgi:flagellar biosynthesis protein FlhG